MAESEKQFLINDILSFIFHKMDLLDRNQLLSICANFYKETEIIEAKETIFSSCQDDLLKANVRTKSYRGENKINDHLKDMVKAFDVLPNEVIPRILCENINNLPPITSEHTDITVLQTKINCLRETYVSKEKHEAELSSIKETMATMKNEQQRLESIVDDVLKKMTNHDYTKRKDPVPNDAVNPIAKTNKIVEVQTSQENPAHDQDEAAGLSFISEDTLGQSQVPTDGNTEWIQIARRLRGSTIRSQKDQREPAASRQRPSSNRPKPIMGTKKDSVLTAKKGRITKVYVSRLNEETSEDIMVQYVKDETGIDIKCEQLAHRHGFKSFKIEGFCQSHDQLLNPDLWPEHTVIRRYFDRNTRRANDVNVPKSND